MIGEGSAATGIRTGSASLTTRRLPSTYGCGKPLYLIIKGIDHCAPRSRVRRPVASWSASTRPCWTSFIGLMFALPGAHRAMFWRYRNPELLPNHHFSTQEVISTYPIPIVPAFKKLFQRRSVYTRLVWTVRAACNNAELLRSTRASMRPPATFSPPLAGRSNMLLALIESTSQYKTVQMRSARDSTN